MQRAQNYLTTTPKVGGLLCSGFAGTGVHFRSLIPTPLKHLLNKRTRIVCLRGLYHAGWKNQRTCAKTDKKCCIHTESLWRLSLIGNGLKEKLAILLLLDAIPYITYLNYNFFEFFSNVVYPLVKIKARNFRVNSGLNLRFQFCFHWIWFLLSFCVLYQDNFSNIKPTWGVLDFQMFD